MEFYVLWTNAAGEDVDAILEARCTDEGVIWDVFVDGEIVGSGYEFAQDLSDRAVPRD
jgi:hypothetical protein